MTWRRIVCSRVPNTPTVRGAPLDGTPVRGAEVWRGAFEIEEPVGRQDGRPTRARFGEVAEAERYRVTIRRLEGPALGTPHPGSDRSDRERRRQFEVTRPFVDLDGIADFLSGGEFEIRVDALSEDETIRTASAKFHVHRGKSRSTIEKDSTP